jgi:tight adherence protein C
MMELIVVCFAATVFVVSVILARLLGSGFVQQEARIRALKQRRELVPEEYRQPFSQRVVQPFLDWLTRMTRTKGQAERQNKKAEKLRQMLVRAGLEMSPGTFSALKSGVTLLVAVPTLLVCIKTGKPVLIAAVLGLVCMILPEFLLKKRIEQRKLTIRQQLPDLMDLLVVSVEAGLGFDSAITRLYGQNKCLVTEEFMTVIQDVQMGRNRKEALREMAARNDVPEITTLTTALIQAEQLGVSIKSVLTTQSQMLRKSRKQRAEEKAQKAPIKMMLPTVGLIFPVVFIILLGPAAIRIIKGF